MRRQPASPAGNRRPDGSSINSIKGGGGVGRTNNYPLCPICLGRHTNRCPDRRKGPWVMPTVSCFDVKQHAGPQGPLRAEDDLNAQNALDYRLASEDRTAWLVPNGLSSPDKSITGQ